MTSTNSAYTTGPGWPRRTATHGSFWRAKSFFTWSPRGPSHAGGASPSNARSIPMRCDSWSLTSQPGHSVGSAHSVPESSWQVSASEAQVSDKASFARTPRSPQPPS